ncbi:hypothetical protein AMECASPLE_005522 [Ameca splendens]|uniref:Uncharacterized protein n=1 Tax=Ameca splendens TaxID=208324 RepID=A0ABV0YL77_9TELE
MANMADITNSCSSVLAPSGPAPSVTQPAIPTQLRTRARSRNAWGARERGGGRGREMMLDADDGLGTSSFQTRDVMLLYTRVLLAFDLKITIKYNKTGINLHCIILQKLKRPID